LGLLQAFKRFGRKTQGLIASSRSSVANKYLFGTAALLAILVLPLAVQAIAGSDEPDATSSPQSEAGGQVEGAVSGEGGSSNSSNIDTSVDVSNDAGDPGEDHKPNVEVTIDGEDVPVPQSGQVHQKKSTNHTESIVDISVQGNSTGSSHTDIQINNQHYSIDDEDDGSGGRLDNHR
jgi:hypothetical protein